MIYQKLPRRPPGRRAAPSLDNYHESFLENGKYIIIPRNVFYYSAEITLVFPENYFIIPRNNALVFPEKYFGVRLRGSTFAQIPYETLHILAIRC